jgi:predicted RNA binding protein YcfA (HicA-like mRNA interferase family)
MARLPAVSGRQAVAAFERAGFGVRRQRGSHVVMTKAGAPETLSVPDHRQLRPGTPRALIRKSGLSVEEFVALLG